jgi:glutamine amidotransferase
MIDIIDYGIGNIGSIQNMIKFIGGKSRIVSEPEEILASKKLILPGVGSFDTAMKKLNNSNLIDAIKLSANRGTYIFGICLGMQLLFEKSEEGDLLGLGLIKGRVIKFRDITLRIPHVGWNKVTPTKKSSLFINNFDHQKFYFTHSYHIECDNIENVIATTNYGLEFQCAVECENVFGTQFHPEKSHKYGMNLFSNYSDL